MHFASLYTFIALVFLGSHVLGDVEVLKPTAGDSYSASSGSVSIPITWEDDDDSSSSSSLANAISYTISLCTGLNSDIQCFDTLLSDQSLTSYSYSATIKNSDAPNGWYYFQIYTTFTSGWTNHYTPRFQLTGMSGSALVTITKKPTSLVVTETGDPPLPQLSAGENSINSKSFSIPYTSQTGKSRFAPMQTQPGASVTATTWSMQFPTSSVSFYASFAKTPNVLTTITPGWSYTPVSAVNQASVAPYPTYYYPASDRVTKASLSSASKRRRWLD